MLRKSPTLLLPHFYSLTKLIAHYPVVILQSIVSLLATLILLIPIITILHFLNSVTRVIVNVYLKITNKQTKLTTRGLGNIWGYETSDKTNSRNVLSLVVYSEMINAEKYRSDFVNNVIDYKTEEGLYPYKNLTKIFIKKCGYYCWREDTNFNIKNHVIIIEDLISESELFDKLSYYSNDMDENHPQWQEIIIKRFTYNNKDSVQSIRILRFHHSFGDAGSFIMMYSYCMAGGRIPYAVDPLKGYNVKLYQKILYYLKAFVLCSKFIVKSVYGGTWVKRNRLVTNCYSGKRYYGWTNILNLDRLKEIKYKTGVSIPAILATVIGAGLKKFDEKYASELKFERMTEIGAVAAILPYRNLKLTNRFTIANFGIPTNNEEILKRLKYTDENLRKLVRSPEPILNYLMFDFFGGFPVRVQNWMMRSAGTCMVFSNLPGAKEPFYLNGDEVVDGGAWVPLLTVAGLSISAAGYKDGLRICGGTDSACMSGEELKFLLDSVESEVDGLYGEVVGVV